jgi:succinoglycan biosynthesis protein ExoM
MNVVLIVLTFQRPTGLCRALDAIGRLETPSDGTISLDAVVVDNDVAGSARALVEGAAADFPIPLDYVIEPVRGIPQARNRAVAIATARGADLIGFIDDDEEPQPDWLERMLEVRTRTGADVVAGRYQPVFERPPSRWMVDGRFFEPVRYRTGDIISSTHARTSGVLISTSKLPAGGPPFDERLQLTGGSDTAFFRRIERDGGKIVWCDEGVVIEHVPESRSSWRWLVKRKYRVGNNQSLFLLYFDNPSTMRKLRRLGGGTARVISGVGLMLTGTMKGRAELVRGARRAAEGAGGIVGIFGLQYREYQHIHGR